MTTDAYAPSAVGERIRELCRQFRLPLWRLRPWTASAMPDTPTPFRHPDGEVLEQEAEDRRIRRVDRLRRIRSSPPARPGTRSSTSGLR